MTYDKSILENLGPLSSFVGIWEGAKGDDIAPDDDRKGPENNAYRERMSFEPFGPQTNHEQVLYGLRYSTRAWRLTESNPFHEDMGYWLWDRQANQIMKCFVIPRGITVIAGGTVDPNSKSFTIKASEKSGTYGLCHNLFLEREFRIISFELTMKAVDSKTFSYEQNTRLLLKDRKDVFDHRDKNILTRID